MESRSRARLITDFILFPIALGGVVLVMAVRSMARFADRMTIADWCLQSLAGVVFGLLVPVSLTAVAIQELRRRAAIRRAESSVSACAATRAEAIGRPGSAARETGTATAPAPSSVP